MHVDIFGSGANVVVGYHGWAGDGRDFAAIGRRMQEPWRLEAVDLPGCGRSEPPGEWTEAAIVDALERHLRSLGGRRVTLAGFCSGAVFALLAWERCPEMVGRIVMIDPFAFVPWYFRVFTLGAFGRNAYRLTFESALGRAITERALRRRQTSDAQFTAAFRRADHTAIRNYLGILVAVGTVRRFGGLDVPVSICHGSRTFAAVRESVGIYAQAWQNVDVHEIPDAGHLIMVHGAQSIRRVLVGPSEPAQDGPRRTPGGTGSIAGA